MATVQEKIELLHEKLAKVKAGGGEKRIEKQHAQGKMTARERLAKLFDDNSFVELDQFVKHRCVNFGQEKKELPGEGVVTGLWYYRRSFSVRIRTRLHCRRWFSW